VTVLYALLYSPLFTLALICTCRERARSSSVLPAACLVAAPGPHIPISSLMSRLFLVCAVLMHDLRE
jgi:hypothetical protein